MTEDQQKLARAFVSLPHWRWMPGMLVCGRPPLRVGCGALTSKWHDPLPDLNDPATMGCILALVREARARPHAFAMQIGKWWRVGDSMEWLAQSQSSEVGALYEALRGAA